MMRLTKLSFFVSVVAAACLCAEPGFCQEVSGDRFQLSPLRIQYGVGNVRLESMGGFLIAVPDENNEINLSDFAENPAGFGDDRESWVMESRYGYREFVQPRIKEGPVPIGVQDLKVQEMVLSFGSYVPGNYGAGVQVNTNSARAFTRGGLALQPRPLDLPAFETFDVFGFKVISSKYLSEDLSVGVSLNLTSENAVSKSQNYYDIDHDAAGVRGGLGLSWSALSGVTLGVKGELVSNSITGVSEDGIHRDEFQWDRPTSLVSTHVFIDRGRLHLGVDYANKDATGFEDVTTSWSSRFKDNPGDEGIGQSLDVFSEDRTAAQLRARGQFDVTDMILLSGLYIDQEVDFSVTSIPNVRGSWDGQEVANDNETLVLGAAWKLMGNRLLLAGEFQSGTSDLNVIRPDVRLDVENSTLDTSSLRGGAEFFLNEGILLRGGLTRENETLKIKDHPRGSQPSLKSEGDYSTTRLAFGVGLVPKGGILQVDVGFDVVLFSDLDQRHTNAGAYVKYLF